MALTPKTWLDRPPGLDPMVGETVRDWLARVSAYSAANPTLVTPLTAAALTDLETRLAAYTDATPDRSRALNVKNADYGPGVGYLHGAIADGTSRPLSGFFATLAAAQAVYPHAVALTDELDWAAVQKALNASPATGGAVEMPAGRYKLNRTLKVDKHAMMLFGHGAGQRFGATQDAVATRLEPTPTFVGTEIILVELAGTTTTPIYGANFRDFTIDGQLTGPAALAGVVFRSNRGLMFHVHIHKTLGPGLRVKGYASPNFDTYDTIIEACEIGDCAAEGLYMDTDSADCHIKSCVLFNNNHNLRITAASQQVTGCHFYNATTHNVYIRGGGSRSKFSNCKIEGSGSHGVNIDATDGGFSDLQFVGNNFKNSGDAADNTADHIIVQGPSANGVTRTLIVGNEFSHQSSASANRPRYGVNFNSSVAQGGVVVGNEFGPSTHWGTAPIHDATPLSNPATIGWNNGATAGGNVFARDQFTWTAEQRFNSDLVLNGLKIPAGLAVVPIGTTGATTYSYRVSALTAAEETLACVAVQITNGNAALSATNYNTLSWTSVSSAESYNVYGRTAAGEQFLANVKATTWDDDGTLTPVAPTAAGLVAPTGQALKLKLWQDQSSSPLVIDDYLGVRVWRINPLGELAWSDATGAVDVYLGRGATKRLDCSGGLRFTDTAGRAFVELHESSAAPTTPAADYVRLYAEDTGGGKTRLCARFSSGTSVVIATDP